MKLKLAFAAVMTACATPALAAPWMAIDANPNVMVMVDRGSITIQGGVRTAQTLWIVKGRQPVVSTLRLHCSKWKFEDTGQQPLNRDLSLAPMIPGSSVQNDAPEGSIGSAVLASVCMNMVTNRTAGWTRPDLKSALDAAKAAGYTPVWP